MAIGEIGLSTAMRSNLITLQSTTRQMGITEERLSSGKRVNTAVDNPPTSSQRKATTLAPTC